MNNQAVLTDAGVWSPVDPANLTPTNTGAVVSHSALIRINAAGQYGIVVAGWGWQGNFGGAGAPEKVTIGLLSPDSSGNLSVTTSSYIGDPVTNGANSILVADFNDDGRSDIFLAAHNESPFVARPSTAYLSNALGGYTKVTLADNVMAHDAEIAYINSKPVVITTTYSPGDINPIYTYENGTFIASKSSYDATFNGMSTSVGNFGKNGAVELVRGDVMTGYDSASHSFNSSTINVYAFNGSSITSSTPLQVITPYLSTLPQYQNYHSEWGKNITHTYRVWSDDLNHDGQLDVLAGQSMWSTSDSFYPSCLQVLINNGDGTFKDMTNTLNPNIGYDHAEFDYNPTFVDIDNSGINTYLFSSFSYNSLARQSNYVLLNDGTGHLYAGVHDLFTQLTPQIFGFLQQKYATNYFIDTQSAPKFIAVPQPDGYINFVAEVAVSVKNSVTQLWQSEYAFVNIPLGYNPTYDFKESVSISDRNSSSLIRTWAGNDSFYDTNASAQAHIDGGLGIDKSNYSDKFSNYSVKATGSEGFEVKHLTNSQAPDVNDTLVNVERLRFADTNVALDIVGVSGQAYRLYKAAFDRTPDKEGLGYWINAFDNGADLAGVASSFIASPEFVAMYGANSTDTNFVTLLYNHVLHRNPDAEGNAYWLNALQHGMTRGAVLASFSESPENISQTSQLIANGIQYQEWLG